MEEIKKNKVEEEEDYMSDDILNQIEEKRPGLVFSRATARKFQLEKKHEEKNECAKKKQIPIRLLEDKQREEALKKSVLDEANKGFNLMLKMGYKTGEALGRQSGMKKSVITEPISVQLKSDRAGLGEGEEKKRKIEEMAKMRAGFERNRQEAVKVSTEAYLDKKRNVFLIRKLRHSLLKCQKICFQLDSVKQNLKEPKIAWFWPRNVLKECIKEPEKLSQEGNVSKVEPESNSENEEEGEERLSFAYIEKSQVDLKKVYSQRLEQFLKEDEDKEITKVEKVKKPKRNEIEEFDSEEEVENDEVISGEYSVEFSDKVRREKTIESENENETEDEDNEEVKTQKKAFSYYVNSRLMLNV